MSLPQALQALGVSALDRHEIELIEQVMGAIAAQSPSDASVLRGLIFELQQTHDLLDRQRPLRRPTALGGEARNELTLIEHLCTMDGLSGDLILPLKATQSRTYLLTKINFLRCLVKATSVLSESAASLRMTHDLREELAQSIYTLLAEELFLALLRKPDVSRRTKQRAADQLITVWDDAALEIDDFAPLLESAWHARSRVNSAYGTLRGATQTFQLVTENCSPEVLGFFGREGMSADEAAAFEEFLFNMTSEELAALRGEMQHQRLTSVSAVWVAELLGRQIEEVERFHQADPMTMYRSYRRRQLAADFRRVSNTPGPRWTAEDYFMVYLLDAAWSEGPSWAENASKRLAPQTSSFGPVSATRQSLAGSIEARGPSSYGGDGGGPPLSGGSGGPPSMSQGMLVTRDVDVSCPPRVAQTCDRFPLTIALVARAPKGSAIHASLELRPDVLVDIQLTAPEFQILGPTHARISIDGDRAVFFLCPIQLGRASVTVDFAQGGNPLGTFAIAIEVVKQDVPYDAAPQPPRELQMYVGAEPPDYVLLISYEPRGEHTLRFCLRSCDDLDQGRTFAPVPLRCDPEEFMGAKYRDLDVLRRGIDPVAAAQQGTTRALAHDQIEERLKKLGYGLWKSLIPPDLKEYYGKCREAWRDKTFVIISDEPSIPWELMWPYDDSRYEWEDPDPWCLTLRLSRWLRRDEQGNGSAGPPSTLPLTQLATLIPSDTGLPATRAESDYLRTFVQRHGVRDSGVVPANKSDALHVLSAGTYDWLHAAAHGTTRDVVDKTIPVWLENGEALTPDDILGPNIERHIRARRPAFVLNACTAARSGWELTGMSGWANQLIKVGAGLFLAPLWSVTDGVAKEFVQVFYDQLAKNARVADAMRAGRLAARRAKGDPTWMAYVLFAHPNARVTLGLANRTL